MGADSVLFMPVLGFCRILAPFGIENRGVDGIIVNSMGVICRFRPFIAGLMMLLIVSAGSMAVASSANLSRSFNSTEKIENGSLVSLEAQRSDYVEPANTDNAKRLIGVAANANDSLLAVDPTTGKVQVATSGNASALVSTLNGNVKVGDLIAVSPFSGIGMKSVYGAKVIGLAQTNLNDSTAGAVSKQVTDKDGKTSTIKVGLVRVSLDVRTDNNSRGVQLNALQRAAEVLTGRTVPTIRVVISLIIAIVALAALVTLIYGAIYSSIVSIGRNPLAKVAVFKSLGWVLTMAAATALLAGITIFFLLR